jgi:hypothetical protein
MRQFGVMSGGWDCARWAAINISRGGLYAGTLNESILLGLGFFISIYKS